MREKKKKKGKQNKQESWVVDQLKDALFRWIKIQCVI